MKVVKLINVLYGVAILFLINIPIIKVLILSSTLINLIGTGLLIIAASLRIMRYKKIGFTNRVLTALITLCIFWIIHLTSIFWGPIEAMDFKTLLQYINIFLISILILLSAKEDDVKIYLFLQTYFSLFIAILHLTVGIQTDADLGQHYLTIGLPLGIGLVSTVGQIIRKINERKFWFHYLLFIIIIIISLVSLNGRSPIVFSTLTVISFWLIYILTYKKYRIRNISILISLVIIGYYVFQNFFNEKLLNRFMRIYDPNFEEPRIYIYRTTIDLILNNIKGYGLNSFEFITSLNYPHNIFLEVTFYSGILGLIVFCLFIGIFINSIVFAFKNELINIIVLSVIATYIFLMWNISFNLTSSYIPFTIISLLISSSKINSSNKIIN